MGAETSTARDNVHQAAAPPAAATQAVVKAVAAGIPRLITMEEVEGHTTEESAWFVHEGKVITLLPPGGGLLLCRRLCSGRGENYATVSPPAALSIAPL